MGLYRGVLLATTLACGCLTAPPEGGEVGLRPDGCGTLRALSDDFSDGMSGWLWEPEGLWSDGGGTLQLTPTPDTESAIYSRGELLVEGGELVVGFGPGAMSADSELGISLVANDREVTMRVSDGTLYADVRQPGFDGSRASTLYDPASRWWRISRRDGLFHWGTRASDGEWKDLEPFEADLEGPAMVVIYHRARSESSEVTVSSVNGSLTSEPSCPIDSFTDDFSQGTRWDVVGPEACTVRFAQQAEIGLTAADACGLITRERYSLDSSRAAVELRDPGDCALNPSLQINYPDGSFALTCIAAANEGGPLLVAFFSHGEAYDELGSTTWDPELTRFLQIRHAPDAGGVVYEISPDGADWSRLATASDLEGADLSSVEISLLIYSDNPPTDPTVFDQLNILQDAE